MTCPMNLLKVYLFVGPTGVGKTELAKAQGTTLYHPPGSPQIRQKLEALENLVEALDVPVEALDVPVEALDVPVEALEVPVEALEDLVEAFDVPLEALDVD